MFIKMQGSIKQADLIIPMVGNAHQKRKPNKNDKNIMLINEYDNPHDKNAIGVYSKSKDSITKLGYVIKDKTSQIKNIENQIESISIIRSAEKVPDSDRYYYYLMIKIQNQF